MTDRISVVVISRNEGGELRRTVENFDDTLPAGSEIVVVDDGSTDGSAGSVANGAAGSSCIAWRIMVWRVPGTSAPARHGAM